MKRKRFNVEQIACAIAQSERATAVTEICRQMGVSKPKFYRWAGDCGRVRPVPEVMRA